ncbi:lysophospholipid acyltransferase family protein [Poseidonocella sedimentorum]|uniref:Lyso-ornithine lipid acyltransferase n=1 Tax=Poseidonocella sedimentorum TaxID=871652 RepID=A0A1I6EIE0_9RHOB|nr:lysophospholipid acyltransferase family protein [Poseidonocella sedimentorum]SFR17465.1 lyso-ornithine lipid acyltransferase [Poseidonocella sedimentorum]
MSTWEGDGRPPPPAPRIGLRGWLRVVWRGPLLAGLVFGGLAVLLLVRLVEQPLYGLHRPVTPRITRAVCRGALRLLNLPLIIRGAPMQSHGAMVANHASWLDIFALNAGATLYFVSKAEVAGWPGIGWLARATGTVFIRRDRRDARAQVALLRARLDAGHRLLFFPEGTSTDGRRVLPFKPTLLAALTGDAPANDIQPITLTYIAPPGEDPRFYGWWGDMALGPHLLKTLAQSPQGRIEVTYHTPVQPAAYPDRKALAAALEAQVRSGFQEG